MSSSWFGESFANIKGQISNFTKEVLTAEDEEEQVDASEFARLKAEVTSLSETCKQQSDTIQQLQTNQTELEDRCKATELQNKSCKDSYQELLKTSKEEKDQLKEQLEKLQTTYKNETKTEVERQGETGDAEKRRRESNILLEFEEKRGPIQKKDEATETETESQTHDDQLFVKELEERCSSYQNDLYIIRNELMNLQREADQAEERNAKFCEDVTVMLHSDFNLDGQSIFKSSHQQSTDGNALILSKLRELAFQWKDLVEKKSTLERTVTKLSIPFHVQSSSTSQPSVIPTGGQSPHSSNTTNIIDLFNEPFFPPKIDSFGLETILEEDRGDEEPSRCEEPSADLIYEEGFGHGGGSGGTSHFVRRKGTPSPATTTISSNCSTQTDGDEELEEPTSDRESGVTSLLTSQANELAVFQEKAEQWKQTEAELVAKLEERNVRIGRLELDLGRLRSHLVDLEEQTNGEALLSAKREEQLQIQLRQLKNELSRTLQQNEPSLDVREEITKLSQERNSYRNANSNLEDQVSKLNAQLQNLHFVLEQFQREKDLEVRSVEKRLGLEMRQLEQKNEVLGKELEKERKLLERAKSGLDAAHQLNAQIEDKTKSILSLKAQVQEKETEIQKLKSKMDEVANTLDGKIDRYLIKNLVVGYFSTPDDKRSEVLRLLATVLDFNREDRQKTGLESGFSLWPIGRRTSAATAEKQSLSEAFIQFLEKESKPKVELRMSVDEVTRNSQGSSSPSSAMMTPSEGTAGRESPATASEESVGSRSMPQISMSLPVLNQADRSNSILKDILNPKP